MSSRMKPSPLDNVILNQGRYVMVDVCSGLGGASEAMLLDPGWNVIRLDSDPLGVLAAAWPACTHRYDIDEIAWERDAFHYVKPGAIRLLWGSPPCREFSLAFAAPGPVAHRAGEVFEPNMKILEDFLELRRRWEPKYWCIENVVGAIPHFRPYLGEPSQIIGPFVLWHNLPQVSVDYSFNHTKADQDTWSSNPLRQNIKGKLPIEISEAVRRAAESPTLEAF